MNALAGILSVVVAKKGLEETARGLTEEEKEEEEEETGAEE